MIRKPNRSRPNHELGLSHEQQNRPQDASQLEQGPLVNFLVGRVGGRSVKSLSPQSKDSKRRFYEVD